MCFNLDLKSSSESIGRRLSGRSSMRRGDVVIWDERQKEELNIRLDGMSMKAFV